MLQKRCSRSHGRHAELVCRWQASMACTGVNVAPCCVEGRTRSMPAAHCRHSHHVAVCQLARRRPDDSRRSLETRSCPHLSSSGAARAARTSPRRPAPALPARRRQLRPHIRPSPARHSPLVVGRCESGDRRPRTDSESPSSRSPLLSLHLPPPSAALPICVRTAAPTRASAGACELSGAVLAARRTCPTRALPSWAMRFVATASSCHATIRL